MITIPISLNTRGHDVLNQCLFSMVKSVARIRYKRISGIGIPVVVKHRSTDHRLRYLHTTKYCTQTSFASLQTKLNKSTQPIQADRLAIDSQLVKCLWLPHNSWKGWVVSQDSHRKLCDAQQRIERRVIPFSRKSQQWNVRNSAIKELEKPHLSLTFQTHAFHFHKLFSYRCTSQSCFVISTYTTSRHQ